MLHAFNQKNVRRVLTSARSEHVIGKDEDGVTSMVFTPLAFMTPEAAADVLHAIVGGTLGEMFGGRRPTGHEVLLWPRGLRDHAPGETGPTRCEPDLLVRFEFDEGRQIVVICEIKWNWKVGYDHLQAQIDQQRRAVRSTYANADQVVLTITKWPIRQSLKGVAGRTWVHVHRAATTLRRRSPASPAARWGALVAEFLSLAEQMDFQGFTSDIPPVSVTSTMFWKDPK